ncbi:MAG: very short patch repair endonuclease [bacterium]|nr:very short patch repair endonuclease [bacterium]
MSQIKARNTTLELNFRKSLYSAGLKNYRIKTKIYGKPDVFFPKNKLAVFLDGCFWHKCPRCYIAPASNAGFWKEKIRENIKRDRKISMYLRKNGIKVLRFWGHQIKTNPNKCIAKVMDYLEKNEK